MTQRRELVFVPVFVRAIELNTLVDGVLSPTDYAEPVTLVFPLSEADLALVDGDTSRLGVLFFNEETGAWESIEVTYEADPAPAGLRECANRRRR